ncbi:hypothetical protein GQ53DRAFT_446207 [Thozetella sp. PMI_491]|nr:hypothetical protein GQ53DRAFT_446207 [Thozetella sp. PMI_491]
MDEFRCVFLFGGHGGRIRGKGKKSSWGAVASVAAYESWSPLLVGWLALLLATASCSGVRVVVTAGLESSPHYRQSLADWADKKLKTQDVRSRLVSAFLVSRFNVGRWAKTGRVWCRSPFVCLVTLTLLL